ncbi:MAG: hypothetical protein IJ043_03130 [Clostridia bacterium]|nr:hypothetical protein [Clostridia bacterium]
MTAQELSQLYYLEREIAEEEERLAEVRARGYTAKGSKLDAMPGGEVGSSVEAIGSEIVDLERRIAAKRRELARLKDYISTVPDSLIRQILHYRYELRCSWHGVARRVGGGNTNESVRKAAHRYLQKN